MRANKGLKKRESEKKHTHKAELLQWCGAEMNYRPTISWQSDVMQNRKRKNGRLRAQAKEANYNTLNRATSDTYFFFISFA